MLFQVPVLVMLVVPTLENCAFCQVPLLLTVSVPVVATCATLPQLPLLVMAIVGVEEPVFIGVDQIAVLSNVKSALMP